MCATFFIMSGQYKKKIKLSPKPPFSPQAGLGFAWRLGAELISGILVGLFLGYAIDGTWGTQPWGLVSMVVLGSAAGLLNIFRMLGLWGKAAVKTSPPPEEEKDG